MLQRESRMRVADNTGAREVLIIQVTGGSSHRYAHVGDIVKVVVKDSIPGASVKKSSVAFAVVVRCSHPTKRSDGSTIRSSDNACVIIKEKDNLDPRGTRVTGAVFREIRDRGFTKIASLATEVL